MANHQVQSEQKLMTIIKYAPVGLAEIDSAGEIIELNVQGEALLKPIFIANGVSGSNFHAVLEQIAPAVVKKIKDSPDKPAHILSNELHSFYLSFGGESVERHFTFTVIKMHTDCIIVSFDDMTQKRQKENAIQQILADKSILQGKFEIASNILHDIGNAVVGFGSYVTRIRRSLDQSNIGNLQKLTDFLATQQSIIAPVIGDAKAEAVTKMLTGINESQKNNDEEIRRSVIEQQNIITHIQDILNIQRQYVNGSMAQEKKPVNLRTVITDCMSMVFASIEKRAIIISISMPDVLPVITGDRTRLMQVILNILKNSIEAIDITATEKAISLNVTKVDDTLIFQIRDNGHGFDKATGKQLFERGFTTKASGSGLGLNSCRSIIESHDGTIDITSEGFGKGALTTLKFKI